jgi:hypothetical protein
MARCERCNACQSQYDFSDCKYCGFPGSDIREPEEVLRDDIEIVLDSIQKNLWNLNKEELNHVLGTIKTLPQL